VTVVVLLAIVAAAAIVGVWRVLGDAPEEVSLAEAVEVAEQAQENPDPPASPTTAAASREVAGNDDAAPDAADGDAAGVDDGDSAGVSGASDGDSDAAAAADAAMTSTAELDGTWAVDAETGEFTLDDATGSFAGFRVDEELARIGAFTAVGRTGDVSGTLVIAEESVTSVDDRG